MKDGDTRSASVGGIRVLQALGLGNCAGIAKGFGRNSFSTTRGRKRNQYSKTRTIKGFVMGLGQARTQGRSEIRWRERNRSLKTGTVVVTTRLSMATSMLAPLFRLAC